MRTRRELLAGVGAAIALAGCTGDGGEGGTTDGPVSTTTDDTPTTEPTTDTPTETPTETPPEDTTSTPEDSPTETPEPTPEPDPEKDFEEIYKEEMVEVRNLSGTVGEQVDWNTVRDKLEDDEHDLNNINVSSEFIEDLAGHAGQYVKADEGAAALAYGLHEEFNISTDQVIVDARTFNAGQQAPMASILINQEDGGVVKDMYVPAGQAQQPDEDGDVYSYQGHDEPNPEGAEQTLIDAWTAEKEGIANPLDLDGHKALIKSVFNDRIGGQEGYDLINQLNDDFIIGYDADNDPIDIGYTLEGAQLRSEILDPSNINASPESHQTVGIDAWNLVRKGTEFVYNNVKDQSGVFTEFDYSAEGITDEYSENAVEIDLESREGSLILDTVGEDRMEELKRDPFPEYN